MNKTTLSVQELASQLGIGLSKAYALVKEIQFDNAYYRNDIGKRAKEAK